MGVLLQGLLSLSAMANRSYRADGKEEINLRIECGSKPGFATSGWLATTTYKVNCIAEDPMQSVVDKIKEQAPSSRAHELYGVDKKTGAKITFDFAKTVEENGITPTTCPM